MLYTEERSQLDIFSQNLIRKADENFDVGECIGVYHPR